MTRACSWVVGRGGLLGSAIERQLEGQTFVPVHAPQWESAHVGSQLTHAVTAFAAQVAKGVEPWQLIWSAGAGVVGTKAEDLRRETAVLRGVLLEMHKHEALWQRPGTLFLASSAGGVHGGSKEAYTTEHSQPAPISDYGRAKLEQELLLREFAERKAQLNLLVGRFSNLYGPGQRLDKPQGLISQLCRCLIYGIPAHVYVSLDTIRDYLFADDAARMVVAGLERLSRTQQPTRETKIYASGKEASIATVLGMFRNLTKRNLKVVMGMHALRAQQPSRLVFRSVVWPQDAALRKTGLLEGVGAVYQHQLALFARGQLPRPDVPLQSVAPASVRQYR